MCTSTLVKCELYMTYFEYIFKQKFKIMDRDLIDVTIIFYFLDTNDDQLV